MKNVPEPDGQPLEWEKFFAWKPVPTPGYIRPTEWLSTAYRRRNQITGKMEYKKTYTIEEEVDLLKDRIAW